ncbi:oxidative stress defense protein [Vibrio sp. DW001]|uniref:oxidative stress defense protein n=1 Tax=Vibrio sp. DW001 TaxID=2912315 RepID=UPI0023B0C053|nr:oxidative stress defense protein [Vibrio sp. DW001]WED27066.1 oxidative stress defense protein [Vibrio sp. DW001]
MKRILTSIVVILSLYSIPSRAENWNFPHLETSGYGEVIVKPDMAEFTVRVEESTLTAEDAKKRVDDVVTAFIARLTNAGVSRDDISATNIHLSPKYSYPKSGKSELVGYQASRSMTVVVTQLEHLNTYIDGALGDGINRIDTIKLKVTEHKKYQELARNEAIKDANEKAQSLAKGFGMDLDGVWKISYNNSYAPPIMMKTMDSRSESSPAGYDDSALVIKDRVSVIYKLAD